MMRACLHLFTFLCVAYSGVDPVDKRCPPESPCTLHDQCPIAVTQFQKLSQLDKESKEYEDLASQVRLSVCNKMERAVCCQHNQGEVKR